MDKKKVIKGLEWILDGDRFGFGENWHIDSEPKTEEEQAGYNIQRAIELLKEQGASTLGMKITADGITFTAEGDAKIGEQRGTMLGKIYMYDQIAKELLYANLWTEEIKKVFDKVKRKTLED